MALIIIENILKIVPVSLVWRCGALLGALTYQLTPKRRKITQDNLKLVQPQLDDDAIEKLSKTVFRNSIANILCSQKTATLSEQKLKKLVTIENREIIDRSAADQGSIFLLFHMGNWEILSRLAKLLDYDKPTGALFQPLKNALINEHIHKSREKSGTRLFARRKGLLEAAKFLKKGGALGILCDQNAGKNGVKQLLFGKETLLTPLPTSLATKYQCPIIPLSVSTTRPGRWHIRLHEPIKIAPELSKEEASALLIPVMENIMAQHTEDFFWLHALWKKRSFKKRKIAE